MEHLICFEEARRFLGIQKSTLYDWVQQRKLPYIKIGRLLKFRKEDLIDFVKSNTIEKADG